MPRTPPSIPGPEHRPSGLLPATVLALALGGLGGCGGAGPAPEAATLATQKSVLRAPAAETPAAATDAAPASLATVGARELFDWAEYRYAELFPKGPQDSDIRFQGQAYTVRTYGNGNALGLRVDGQVFGLGPFTGDVLLPLGALADYVALVQADRCQVYPGSCGGPRSWAGAALLENSNDFNVEFGNQGPLSVVDRDGNALVVWEQSDGVPDGATRKVFWRRQRAGQGWGPATSIPGLLVNRSAIAVDGRLFADAAGQVTWVNPSLAARRFTPAGGWATTVIAAPGAGVGSLYEAQMDAGGTVHALRSGGGNVWYTTLPAGATQWTTAVAIAGSNNAVSGGARLAVGPAGAVAIWRERNPGDSNDSLWASRRVGSTWQTKVRIEELFTQVRYSPALAMDAAGNALAAWHQGSSLVVNRLDAGTGAWGEATEFDVNQLGSNFDPRISVVMHPDGRAVIGWNSGIFALKTMGFAPSSGFTAPVTAAGYSIDRTLRMDDQARVVLVHRSDPGFPGGAVGINVRTQELPWGGSWSPTVRLDTGAGGVLDKVSFSMNPSGLGVVSWAQNDVANSSARNSLWANLRR